MHARGIDETRFMKATVCEHERGTCLPFFERSCVTYNRTSVNP